MQSMASSRFPRFLTAWACFLAVLLVTTLASAYGRVQWKSKRLKESKSRGGSWKIELTIFMPRAPDLPTIPAKFEFKQNVYFERYKDDAHGDKPQTRRVPTPGKQPIIEGVDMGFLDPSSGTIQKRTKFSFKITRAHGFEAGEWTVKMRDARNGRPIGQQVRLVLEGENKVIDRRSMVFASKEDKKKDDEGDDEESSDEGGDEDSGDTQKVDLEDNEEFWPEVEEEPPPPVEEKPGACGCRAAGTSSSKPGLLLVPLVLGLGLFLRRKNGLVAKLPGLPQHPPSTPAAAQPEAAR
jgi:MYXO-CTERM domain-containing protein